jgi:enamine deaminase RidA (YjgF/YER057c/UK114 family)
MAKREVVEFPGIPKHKQPISTCVKIGNMVFTSAINGIDPATQKAPDEPERQIELAFQNMKKIIEAAGGTTENIAKVTVFMKDVAGHREFVNKEWLKLFPGENKPCRHALKYDLGGNMVIQLEMFGVL